MNICTPEKKFVFKLSDLNKLFCQRLKELGMEAQRRIQSTKLKNRIVSHFPGMNPYAGRQEVLVAFNADIGEVHGSSLSISYDDKG